MTDFLHIPVLLDETIDLLNLRADSNVVDCTLGLGGHSKEILKKIPKGKLMAFDQDEVN
ncbi:16S rRNA (cytosine(1402)-N(4))-methyltransferase, partial [Candidatus Pacearchaeota archaeon]|nr:16S rRNA (cytosine(1402)-N(4))-methyltransferase [Candidatus Pacearchaeota archaeon]